MSSDVQGGAVSLSLLGRDFLFDDAGGKDQIVAQIQDGSFEAPLPAMIVESLSRLGGIFIDVGANTGFYTVLACKASPEVSVLSFEPYPIVKESLKRNIALNNLESRVHIYGFALSNSVGEFPLYVPDDSHGLMETSCSLESSFKEHLKGTVRVEVKKLDLMNIVDPVSVIKVDIEGHEHAFLEGAEKTIRKNRPIIFCELLSGARVDFYHNFLPSIGYIDFRLRRDMVIRDQITHFDEAALNHALVPVDKLPVFYDCCRAQQLEVVKQVVI